MYHLPGVRSAGFDRGAVVVGLVAALLASGCIQDGPCPASNASSNAVGAADQTVYQSAGDPYAAGALAVRTLDWARCDQGAPVPLRIHAPTAAGTYAVVVFFHGFVLLNSNYDDILRHLASHGFVVAAPQLYAPGIDALLGNPSIDDEAVLAANLLDWLPAHLSDAAGVSASTDRLGLAGHSRGAKTAWLVLKNDPTRARAVAVVAPADGDGWPIGGQVRVIDEPLGFPFPSLVFGTALAGPCAPEDANHVQFYAASASPAWHIVALDFGHGDMMDEDAAAQAALICNSGPDRERMRLLTGGLLTAFFRGALQDDSAAFAFLSDVDSAPTAISVESK